MAKFGPALAALKAAKVKPATEEASAPTVEAVASPPPRASALGSGDSPESAPPAKRGRGRPRGKRSDTNFEPTTVYLDAELKLRLQDAIRRGNIHKSYGDKATDLSDLINYLLHEWYTFSDGLDSAKRRNRMEAER